MGKKYVSKTSRVIPKHRNIIDKSNPDKSALSTPFLKTVIHRKENKLAKNVKNIIKKFIDSNQV